MSRPACIARSTELRVLQDTKTNAGRNSAEAGQETSKFLSFRGAGAACEPGSYEYRTAVRGRAPAEPRRPRLDFLRQQV
jgi:hypothetical protein